MIITLLSWGIILFLSFPIGKELIDLIAPGSFAGTSKSDVYIAMGILCLNVYAQIYSIFFNVGKISFYIILAVSVLCIFHQFIVKKSAGKPVITIQTWQVCVVFVTAMVVGLWTMRAPNNGDTYGYHAQTIRWIEEYGVVPGLGNLHNRFAYNSASMSLQALFSFS